MKDRKKEIQSIKKFSKDMKKLIFDMALVAGTSHIGGGLSFVDIAATLYCSIMKYNPKKPLMKERDRFILSKGHGVLGYYSALSLAGFIPKEDLKSFGQSGTYLIGHPLINKEKGIEFSNGSLGMGLSLGVGVAIAGKKKEIDYKVYVLLGDGECNEGSVWEAAMSAAQYKLNNLVAIIDKNNFQQTGLNKDIMNLGNVANKWKSFGWETFEVDGHNIEELYDTFNKIDSKDKPTCIIANTIKGKGCSFAENDNAWHHATLTKDKYEEAINNIKEEVN